MMYGGLFVVCGEWCLLLVVAYAVLRSQLCMERFVNSYVVLGKYVTG